MNTWFIWLVVFTMIARRRKEEREAELVRSKACLRRKKGKAKIMEDMIREYLGKDVVIYTLGRSSMVSGVLDLVKDGWCVIKDFESGEAQTVNLEYVVRVREYPKDKNGKRKLIFD